MRHKIIIVHGGSGALGGAAAKAFAREGARVFLTGRTQAKLDAVAAEIAAAGGRAETAVVDAMDPAAVDAHADAVAARAGSIDVVLNAVGVAHLQGTALSDLSYEEFATPLHGVARTNFLTARAAARHMAAQGSGVILLISTPGSQMAATGVLGYGAACATLESMTRHLAGELGPKGVRVICLRSHAIPEAQAKGSYSREAFQQMADRQGVDVPTMLADWGRGGTLLGRLPTLDQFADTAAFMASDSAGAITGAIINMSCGSLVD